MKIAPLVVGLCVILVSILGYFDSPGMISQMVHSIIKTNSGDASVPSTATMLRSMGYPSISSMFPIIRDSFLGLAIVGIGIAGLGIIGKGGAKTRKKEMKKERAETPTGGTADKDRRLSGLEILQERLARGEITSGEFHRLKELLKPDKDT